MGGALSARFDLEAPSFPPLLSGRIVAPGLDPFDAAVEAARAGEDSGAVFWTAEPDLLRVAVVLAPDVPRAPSLGMHFVTAVGLNDALGALGPEKTGMMHLWPDGVMVNGALAGHVRTLLAPCAADEVPDWLATGVALSLRFPRGLAPGAAPRFTALSEEGCGDLTAAQIIESWSRHFLTWLHRWETDGPRPVFDAWLNRAAGRSEDAAFEIAGAALQGRLLGLAEDGSATLRAGDAARVFPLDAALAQPTPWPPAEFAQAGMSRWEGAR
ncbi:MAG: biotin/lipoate--protein ligase family protein [Rubrimonas sp.]|uniref:biotin/lipoate--protein ligase family protein n=1 Tax=Rubrimonas sp. TaxID=2036015 RepID=UPI002FDED6A5